MQIVNIISQYTRSPYTIKDLLGKTLTKIVHNKGILKTYSNSEELIFCCDDGEYYAMFHDQDCCEYVNLEDIVGDLDSLIGSPILMAREDSNGGYTDGDHETWTFYNIATIKGIVTLRWYGTSNGYYSESVNIYRVEVEE